MRNLFLSERRCIDNLIELKWGRRCESAPTVLAEHTATPTRPRRRPCFNCDFSLEFVDRKTPREHVATMTPVLPNTLGAELFLVVESVSLTPLWLELIGGEAFSITYFADLIQHTQAAVNSALGEDKTEGIPVPGDPAALVKNAACARVLMVGDDVTFLYFVNEHVPVLRGSRHSLVRSRDREIDCYVDGHEIVCFDGWVRVCMQRAPDVLVATSE